MGDQDRIQKKQSFATQSNLENEDSSVESLSFQDNDTSSPLKKLVFTEIEEKVQTSGQQPTTTKKKTTQRCRCLHKQTRPSRSKKVSTTHYPRKTRRNITPTKGKRLGQIHINVKKEDTYRAPQKYLLESEMGFHTYFGTLDMRVVIRGLPISSEAKEIKED